MKKICGCCLGHASSDMNEIVERKFKGDKVSMEILREGNPMEVEIELKP